MQSGLEKMETGTSSFLANIASACRAGTKQGKSMRHPWQLTQATKHTIKGREKEHAAMHDSVNVFTNAAETKNE